MAEALATLTFGASGGALVVPVGDSIERVRPTRPSVEVSFDFSPHGSTFTYTVGATTYTPTTDNLTPGAGNVYYTAALNTTLTFTPTIVLPTSDVRIIEHHWDFGDGTIAYGATSIAHAYATPGTHQVVLCLTDNFGRRVCVRKPMYVS